MIFCALTVDQHKSLYKLIYKNISDDKDFDLNDYSRALYDKILKATNNHDLALTYVSYVPSYVSNMQTEDKGFRQILRNTKTDANELLNKIDDWENNLTKVQEDLQIAGPQRTTTTQATGTSGSTDTVSEKQPTTEATPKPTKEVATQIVDNTLSRAKNKQDIEGIMKTTFNLDPVQAHAVASIYDQVAQTYAKRNNTIPEAFYNTLSFRKGFAANDPTDPLYQIIGEKGASKDILSKFDAAKQLETQGIDSKEIYAKLGVEKGVDGKWRVDLPTDNFKTINDLKTTFDTLKEANNNGNDVMLAGIIHYPELFAAYPKLKELRVNIENGYKTRGSVSWDVSEKKGKEIYEPLLGLNPEEIHNSEDLLDVLSHEIQHIIQGIEKFPNGAHPSDFHQEMKNEPEYFGGYDEEEAHKRYLISAGEVEARNAALRRGILDEEKASVPISVTEDVLRSDQTNIGKTLPANSKILFQDKSTNINDLAKKEVNNESLNKIRTSLRNKFGESDYTLSVLDNLQEAKKNDNLIEDDDVAHFIDNGITFGDIANMLNKDEKFDSTSEAFHYLAQIGDTSGIQQNLLNQKEGSIAHAAVSIKEDGTAIIHVLTDPNVSSPLHELAHVWEHQLNDTERKSVLDWTGQEAWDKQTSEQFARGFEAYLAEGEASNFKLQTIFDKFKQWLTDIYKGIFGSEIDVNLNDEMRKVYSDMLGTDFKQKTLEELQAEQDTRSEAQKSIDSYKANEEVSKDYTKPIPKDSVTYWSHLSAIQQAFQSKSYDVLLANNKITAEQLNNIILSTKNTENEGLSSDLVAQTVFRVNNPELISDIDYWKTMPKSDSTEFPAYTRTIREVATNGDMINALKNGALEPQEARDILKAISQIAPAVEQAAKARDAELKAEGKVKDLIDKNNPETSIAASMNDIQTEAAKLPSNLYLDGLKKATTEDEFSDIMQQMSQQLSDPESSDNARKMFGDKISDQALEMFPDEDKTSLSDKYNLSDSEVAKLPDADNNQPLAEGDTVEYNGNRYTINDVMHGDKPAYFLSNGEMVFGNKLQLVTSKVNEDLIDEYNKTAPKVFREIDQELTEPDAADNNDVLNYMGLKTILDRLNVKFNNVIKYEIVASEENFKGRVRNGVIQVNLKNFDKTTPFHEFLHPFVEVLKVDNEELYRNLVQEFAGTKESKAIIEELKNNPAYNKGTAEEIGDEALVRYLATKSAENVTSEGQRIKSKYSSALSRAVDKFKEWFAGTIQKVFGGVSKRATNPNTPTSIKDLSFIPTTATLEDIVDLISLRDTVIDLGQRKAVFESMNKLQEDTVKEDFSDKTIAAIQRKLKILEATSRQPGNEILLKDVIAYRSTLKNPDPTVSLINFMHTGFASITQATSDFSGIKNKLFTAKGNLTQTDLIELNKNLEIVKASLLMADSAIDYYESHPAEKDIDYEHTIYRYNKALGDMRNVSVNLTAEWLTPRLLEFNEKMKDKPEFQMSPEKFRDSLYTASEDVSNAFFWVGSIASSRDAFSALMRDAIASKVQENHVFETNLLTNLKNKYSDFLAKTGLANGRKETQEYYKQHYLRKATVNTYIGKDKVTNDPIYEYKPYWAFHQEFNYDLFDKDRTDFMENKTIFGDTKFDDTNQEHVDKLIAWEKTNGKSVQVGTKPAFDDVFDEAGNKTGTTPTEVPVMKLIPGEKYRNVDYEKVKNDPFFRHLSDEYEQANEKLGDQKLKFGVVPQISKGKGTFADYKGKGAKDVLILAAKKTGQFVLAPPSEELTTDKVSTDLEGNIQHKIGGFYNVHIPNQDEVDLTLPETVAKYSSNANLNNLKEEINPLVKTAQTLVNGSSKLKMEARKVIKTTASGKTVFDPVSGLPAAKEQAKVRLNKQLNEFINDTMYGQSTIQQDIHLPVIGTISLNKLGQNWSFLTALNNMAFNINGGINNLALGKTQEFIEATGSRFFNLKDYRWANLEYAKNIGTFLNEGNSLHKSLITQLAIKYDAIQGEFRDKYGKRFVGNMAERFASTDTLFIINHAAEHNIQVTGMMALMKATKVKLADGTETNLYDAHYLDSKGILRIKDGVQWDQKNDNDFINTWHGINNRLNGNYSTFDKTVLQRRWFGQLVMVYRKFIYESFKTRYSGEYMDYQLGKNDFGYQRKFFAKLGSDIEQYKLGAAQKFFSKEGWNEDEKAAASKTVSELAFLGGAAILAFTIGLTSAGDKKDTDWGKKALLLYLTHYKSDMAMFTPMGYQQYVDIIQNPSAIMNTMTKYATFFKQLGNPGETYQVRTGPFEKGSLKLKADLMKAFPGVKQLVNLWDPNDQLKYYNVFSQKR